MGQRLVPLRRGPGQDDSDHRLRGGDSQEPRRVGRGGAVHKLNPIDP
jgi:hypothetical protein